MHTWRRKIGETLAQDESTTEIAELQDEKLGKTNVDDLKDWLALLPFFQNFPCPQRRCTTRRVAMYCNKATGNRHLPKAGQQCVSPQKWREHIRPLKAPQRKSGSREAVPLQGVISLDILMGDVHPHAHGSASLRTFAVDLLLRTSHFDRSFHYMYPIDCKVVQLHIRPVEIFTSLLKAVSLLQEAVRYEAYAEGSGNTKLIPC